MAKVQERNIYCHNVIQTKHVFSDNNQVYLRNDSTVDCLTEEEWSPIPFEWIKLVQLQDNLVLR